MSATNRSSGRDVFIYDPEDPNTVLGGLLLSSGMTNSNLYSMVEIIMFMKDDYRLRHKHKDGTESQRDGQALQRGDYYIITTGKMLPCITR